MKSVFFVLHNADYYKKYWIITWQFITDSEETLTLHLLRFYVKAVIHLNPLGDRQGFTDNVQT